MEFFTPYKPGNIQKTKPPIQLDTRNIAKTNDISCVTSSFWRTHTIRRVAAFGNLLTLIAEFTVRRIIVLVGQNKHIYKKDEVGALMSVYPNGFKEISKLYTRPLRQG